jgi:hypothetical protein
LLTGLLLIYYQDISAMTTMLSITALFPSLAGWAGTLSYLAAYFLLSINKLKANQAIYHVLNIVGAVGLTYNALVLKDYPNIIVNVCWAIIGGWAIYAIQQGRRN